MLDHDGDENYEPFLIPIDGGFPSRSRPRRSRTHARTSSTSTSMRGSRTSRSSRATEPMVYARRCDFATGAVETLGQSPYGAFPVAYSSDHSRVVLGDQYLPGDVLLYEPDANGGRAILYGTPLDEREPGREYPAAGLRLGAHHAERARDPTHVGDLDDTGSPGYLDFSRPARGRARRLRRHRARRRRRARGAAAPRGDRYAAIFNIDGCSWAYDVRFDEPRAGSPSSGARGQRRPRRRRPARARPRRVVAELRALVLHRDDADAALRARRDRPRPGRANARSASRPSCSPPARTPRSTRTTACASPPASTCRPSARLRRAAAARLLHPRRPAGPGAPDFAWFSMPLIQILTLEGFAVFVPNARGSTGYGLAYTKRVDRDWGGQDRLDHVHAMQEVLPQDERIDVDARRRRRPLVRRLHDAHARGPPSRAVARAVDMFGPYDLVTFSERIPETWKPFFALTLGDPETRKRLPRRALTPHVHRGRRVPAARDPGPERPARRRAGVA